MGDFSHISSRAGLADFLGIPRKTLTYVLYKKGVDSYYTSFDIPKKSGGTRHINAPTGILKTIQSKLAAALWAHQQDVWTSLGITPRLSHAFEKGKSILTNAKIHRNKRYVLNVDLKDFFDQFHFGRVAGFFEKNRYFLLPHDVSIVLAQLACYRGRLPQGAPSSPIITNLMCQMLDQRLLHLAQTYRLDYTRYADDLTFSTNDSAFLPRQGDFLAALRQELQRAGFPLNEEKTRLQYRSSRQEVTGLVVNQKLSVRREFCRDTRAMARHLYTTGSFQIGSAPGTLRALEGRFTFINQLDWYENKLGKKPARTRHTLNGRERQYQEFLFYRTFFAHEKPLIVTEGKTDIAYLKAALKNLHASYPALVQRLPDGTFQFHVNFLRRSKRLEYLFGFSRDGADAMKNLYDYFKTIPRFPVSTGGSTITLTGYPAYFRYLSGTLPKTPVIFVFDNELANSKKPLKNFTNHAHLLNPDLNRLKTDLWVPLLSDHPLFLATNPLVDGKAECEIEDLFPPAVLAHTINGKTFSRDNKDPSAFYGKEIFSQYISHNYRTINFHNFRPLLDALSAIVTSA